MSYTQKNNPFKKAESDKLNPVEPSKTYATRALGTREPKYNVDVMKIKNVEFLPVELKEPHIEQAAPQELSKSDHFTIERVGIGTHTSPKGDDNKPLVRLKDSAGVTIFEGSQEEYTAKYGEVLQRGTKTYGQEDLKRRLYVKK